MPISRGYPIRFTPKGLSDAADATDVFPGACRTLQNLVFDQSNPEIVTSRPGVGLPLVNFNITPHVELFPEPGFISIHVAIGPYLYGMIKSKIEDDVRDVPFYYNIDLGTLSPISGATAGNTPEPLPSTGKWVPPTMAVIGVKIIVTHLGFPGGSGPHFGVIDITDPTVPTWTATNLSPQPLPKVPTNVANFNNRAYFSIGNQVFYSDPLNPISATDAGQSLTIGDATEITGLSGLPIATTTAGVIKGLIVFKPSQIWQVTGDKDLPNDPLTLSYLTLTSGCIAPRSIISTNFGITFMNIAGPYFINYGGAVLPLNAELGGDDQPDIQAPFQNTNDPTRMSAGFLGNIYRICVPTASQFNEEAVNDYWFDLFRRRWNGPHTFIYDCASPVTTSEQGSFFILSSHTNPGKLFKSLVRRQPGRAFEFNDNGVPYNCILSSSTFPKVGHMTEKQVIESTIELASAVQENLSVMANDEDGNKIGGSIVETVSSGGILWTKSPNLHPLWGGPLTNPQGDGDTWTSPYRVASVYTVPWDIPLVFKKMSLNINTSSLNTISIGTFFARYQDCGYTNK